jgi:hypothetical protein
MIDATISLSTREVVMWWGWSSGYVVIKSGEELIDIIFVWNLYRFSAVYDIWSVAWPAPMPCILILSVTWNGGQDGQPLVDWIKEGTVWPGRPLITTTTETIIGPGVAICWTMASNVALTRPSPIPGITTFEELWHPIVFLPGVCTQPGRPIFVTDSLVWWGKPLKVILSTLNLAPYTFWYPFDIRPVGAVINSSTDIIPRLTKTPR